MLHHISFGVSNLERSAAFYDATLSALGYVRVWSDSTAIGRSNYYAAFVVDPDGYRIEAVLNA